MKMYLALSRKKDTPEVYDILHASFTKRGAEQMCEDNFARVAAVDFESIAFLGGSNHDWIEAEIRDARESLEVEIAKLKNGIEHHQAISEFMNFWCP